MKMESKDELKEIDIKNCMCCWDINSSNILLDEKSNRENILIYDIWY